ncbi:hypothetical protein CMCT_0558 [Campylobacter mucosalis]|uniref:hypothetical protein n=1 Tax=Campylobacter mucosalis TaxID=202 RepID=UPI000B03D8C0|nr:hypothetical protein [Campylobacter mucosalis]QKF62713.1 hypothetical protein CMCT_0558 [Campylobacter mucosalis]
MDRLMLTDIEMMTDLNENPVAVEPITKNCDVKIYDENFNNLSVRSSKDSD